MALGVDLPSCDGTGFPSSLGTSEIGYVCVGAPKLQLLHSVLCCCHGGGMAHPFGSLDASEGVLLEAKKVHLQPAHSTGY